eukprot:XP_001697828.1 predicted protein [Chlamydomonas reinhardtii]
MTRTPASLGFSMCLSARLSRIQGVAGSKALCFAISGSSTRTRACRLSLRRTAGAC